MNPIQQSVANAHAQAPAPALTVRERAPSPTPTSTPTRTPTPKDDIAPRADRVSTSPKLEPGPKCGCVSIEVPTSPPEKHTILPALWIFVFPLVATALVALVPFGTPRPKFDPQNVGACVQLFLVGALSTFGLETVARLAHGAPMPKRRDLRGQAARALAAAAVSVAVPLGAQAAGTNPPRLQLLISAASFASLVTVLHHAAARSRARAAGWPSPALPRACAVVAVVVAFPFGLGVLFLAVLFRVGGGPGVCAAIVVFYRFAMTRVGHVVARWGGSFVRPWPKWDAARSVACAIETQTLFHAFAHCTVTAFTYGALPRLLETAEGAWCFAAYEGARQLAHHLYASSPARPGTWLWRNVFYRFSVPVSGLIFGSDELAAVLAASSSVAARRALAEQQSAWAVLGSLLGARRGAGAVWPAEGRGAGGWVYRLAIKLDAPEDPAAEGRGPPAAAALAPTPAPAAAAADPPPDPVDALDQRGVGVGLHGMSDPVALTPREALRLMALEACLEPAAVLVNLLCTSLYFAGAWTYQRPHFPFHGGLVTRSQAGPALARFLALAAASALLSLALFVRTVWLWHAAGYPPLLANARRLARGSGADLAALFSLAVMAPVASSALHSQLLFYFDRDLVRP